jgi:hypothetical protein
LKKALAEASVRANPMQIYPSVGLLVLSEGLPLLFGEPKLLLTRLVAAGLPGLSAIEPHGSHPCGHALRRVALPLALVEPGLRPERDVSSGPGRPLGLEVKPLGLRVRQYPSC